MPWDLDDEELRAVQALPVDARYQYFVTKVADWEEVWSLADQEGWVLLGSTSGDEIVPVWPHPRFAAACSSGAWADAAPRAISLAEFMDEWLPAVERERRRVGVFPLPSGDRMDATPERLRADLAEEAATMG